ncbi:MAG: dimethyl sulfoxide reductase anchor subunit [Aestuariivirgaceae bacterium]|nr:dimethyl sulfoxide reductase anchor subunit [Aestuariivirgaceae bacterium]
MHPAYSVILFTTASGAGYGLLALLAMVAFAHGQASSLAYGLTTTILALGLITSGLLSSTFHLGHPERAWRAFSQWRSSWLSREGVAAVITYAPAVIFAATWSALLPWPQFIAPAAALTGVMCLITVFTTAMIYASLKPIRVWNHWLTVANYVALSLATGAILLSFLSDIFGRGQMFLYGFATILIAIALGFKLAWWRMADTTPKTLTPADAIGIKGKVRQWEVPHTSANYVMKEMGYTVARKHAAKLRRFVLAGFALAALCLILAGLLPLVSIIFTTVALLAGGVAVVTERWLFFAEAQHAVTLYYGAEQA